MDTDHKFLLSIFIVAAMVGAVAIGVMIGQELALEGAPVLVIVLVVAPAATVVTVLGAVLKNVTQRRPRTRRTIWRTRHGSR